MPLWSLDDWAYLERRVVCDPTGRQWSVAVMDVLGQEGDPEVPGHLLELQYAAGRYFTVVYSSGSAIQWERGHTSRAAATAEYERLTAAIAAGTLDPSRPVFRTDLEE